MLEPADVYYDVLSSLTELRLVTKFFAELSNAECAFLSFLFLPLFLLAWLFLLRMFNIGNRLKKVFFITISITYFSLIFYLKYETNNVMKLTRIRDSIIFEMLYRNKIKSSVDQLQDIGLRKWEIVRSADLYSDYFHITSDDGENSVLMLIKKEVVSAIRKKEKDLIDFIEYQGPITIDSLMQKINQEVDYGSIDQNAIERLAKNYPDKIRLKKDMHILSDTLQTIN